MLFCIKVSVRLRKNERKLFSTFLKGYVHGCKISMKKNMVAALFAVMGVSCRCCAILFS